MSDSAFLISVMFAYTVIIAVILYQIVRDTIRQHRTTRRIVFKTGITVYELQKMISRRSALLRQGANGQRRLT